MIIYSQVKDNIQVHLDGKYIGDIKPERVEGSSYPMWRYWPTGRNKKWAGEAFSTIREVKDSLEAE